MITLEKVSKPNVFHGYQKFGETSNNLGPLMKNVIFHHPKRLVFGNNSLKQMADDYLTLGLNRFFIITVPSIMEQLLPVIDYLKSKGIAVQIHLSSKGEPTFADFEQSLSEAKSFKADSVAGIGGGSVMDVAKLIAAQLHNNQPIKSIVGNGLLKQRATYLICMPTTSGTGSEVSPNAILMDQKDKAKRGIISPYLVPDGAYIDPTLTLGLPQSVTAYTGFDALTHCIEAYVNKFSHPMVDVLALEGIGLISRNLKKVIDNGQDLDARSKVALGSVYGGMCLGPVNTAAVHALAYPLGSEFKIAHGISNALLLPYVMEFNLPAAESRYAKIALAMGAEKSATDRETALSGISLIKKLMIDCYVPSHLLTIGVPLKDIHKLAALAMEVKRLLNNNVREITLEDAENIYNAAY
jgi:alcohol dehydrogenase class IV